MQIRLALDNGTRQVAKSWEEVFSIADQIVELDASFNRLKTLPEEINRLKNCQVLRISYNCLTKIPENMPWLEEISACNNQLSEVQEFSHLKRLYVDSNQIETIRGNFPFLEELDISNNIVRFLEGSFPNLQVFRASYNCLYTAPIFPSLRIGIVNFNPSFSVGRSFLSAELISLNLNTGTTQLDGEYFRAKIFSACGGNIGDVIKLRLPAATYVNLSCNQLFDIPKINPNIRTLLIRKNLLSNFCSLSSLTGLKILDVSFNKLDSFEICPFPHLISLNVASNQIISIDPEMAHGKLRYLNISNNFIRTFPTSFRSYYIPIVRFEGNPILDVNVFSGGPIFQWME